MATEFHERSQSDWPARVNTTVKRELESVVSQMHTSGVTYADAVREFKKRYILQVLAQHKGNQCKASVELGMHRNTLSRTIEELGLDPAQIRNGLKRPARSERGLTLSVSNSRSKIQPIYRSGS